MVNSVHDSIVVDVHPSEERQVLDVIKTTNDNMITLIEKEIKLEFNVPLLL